MKVLLVNKYFFLKGGAEASFFDTANLLEKMGHKAMFFSMQHPHNLSSTYGKYFVSNIDYGFNGFRNKISAASRLLYSFEAKKKIERLIKEEKPDIAHLHNIHHQISPSVLSSLKKFKIPIVLTLHDYKMVCPSYSMICNGETCVACRDGAYYRCFLKRCNKDSRIKSLLSTVEMYLHHKILHIYKLVDIFISPSRFLKNKLEEMGFTGDIVYLPNFIRLEEITPVYNWDERSIVYFGRLSNEKGLFDLIDAVKDIRGITLKIIGDGPLEGEIKSRIDIEGIDNVILLGYKRGEGLKNEIRKSMFVILPSTCFENNPMSIIEAFALGKPVIGSRIGGIPELVRDDVTGLSFEAGNPEDLRIKIRYLINNLGKAVEMGKNARLFVEKEFAAKNHYQGLIKIYNQVVNHKL
jgi:glycosyltransferase involved in cell wall biosynthesis